jgi:hypothetical protein
MAKPEADGHNANSERDRNANSMMPLVKPQAWIGRNDKFDGILSYCTF